MEQLLLYGVKVGPSRPHPQTSYTKLISHLRRFKKSELIGKASRALWHIWTNDTIPADQEEDYALTRAYLGRIAALAAACCNEMRPNGQLDGRALANLSGQVLSITEPLSDTRFLTDIEIPEFTTAFNSSTNLKNYPISNDTARLIVARTSLTRTLRAQWDFRSVTPQGVIRAWDIVSRLNNEHSGEIFTRLSKYLNIHPRDYLRAGFLLYTVAPLAQPVGMIDVFNKAMTGELFEKLNLNQDALNLVAHRISRTSIEFREWHNKISAEFPEIYRKYVPHPLVTSPLIKLDESFDGVPNRPGLYICPSPAHIVWRTQSSAIDAVRDMPRLEGENLQAELGDCLSKYVHDFLVSICGRENVIKIDDHVDNKSKHADFIITDGELAIVIECKTSIGSTLAKSVVNPSEIVNIWDRLYGAYLQCSTTIKSNIWKKIPRLSSVKHIASIISFDEVFCPDGPAFNGFAKDSGILADLQLEFIEATSLTEFEEFASTLGVARLFKLISEKWTAGRHDELLSTHYRRFKAEQQESKIRPTHLDQAANDLFPDMNLLKNVDEKLRRARR